MTRVRQIETNMILRSMIPTWLDSVALNAHRHATSCSARFRFVIQAPGTQSAYRTHVIMWHFDSEDEEERTWVRNLRRNQVLVLSVWAVFPGWENHVAAAKMEIVTAESA